MLHRVDRCDTKQKTHRRIRRRSATLAKDGRFLIASEFDQVVDGQEIISEILFADEDQFLRDGFAEFFRDIAVPLARCFPHQMRQPVIGLPAAGYRLVRVFITQIIEGKFYAFKKPGGFSQCAGIPAEQMRHFCWRFKVTLGICLQHVASGLNRSAKADGGQDVVQRTAFRVGI